MEKVDEIIYKDINGLPMPYGFVHVARSRETGLVFCAGEVGVDADGALAGDGGYAAQAEQAMSNLMVAVEAGGATPRRLIKLTAYVVGLGKPGVQDQVYDGLRRATRKFDIRKCPSTMVGVVSLVREDLLVEIDAIAIAESDEERIPTE